MENYYFDTSALVEYYDKRIDFFEMILEKMRNKNIYISEIVENELENKYEKYIYTDEFKISPNIKSTKLKEYIKAIEEFNNQIERYSIESDLNNFLVDLKKLDSGVVKKAEDEFKNKIKDVQNERRKTFSKQMFPYEVISYPYLERLKDIPEARVRMENGVPPGYEDYGKKKTRFDEYNDFFIWKSIMYHAKKNNIEPEKVKNYYVKNYYVTNDNKDCNNERDKPLMEKEFLEETGFEIEIISSNDFLEKIGYDKINCEDYYETLCKLYFDGDYIDKVIDEFFDIYFLKIAKFSKIKYRANSDQKLFSLENPEIYALNIIKFNATIDLTILIERKYDSSFEIELSYGCQIYFNKDNKSIQNVYDIEFIDVDEVAVNTISKEILLYHHKNNPGNWRVLMRKVLERDEYTCLACGDSRYKNDNIVLEVDRIIPFVEGGEMTLDNCQTLCQRCHRQKSRNNVNKNF